MEVWENKNWEAKVQTDPSSHSWGGCLAPHRVTDCLHDLSWILMCSKVASEGFVFKVADQKAISVPEDMSVL